VYHLALGYSWRVHAVLGQWTHPGFPGRTYGRPVIARRLRLQVSGPLPGRPRRRGEFIMIATMYGTGYHWWIRPEQARQEQTANP
jgi:hypothetical protein